MTSASTSATSTTEPATARSAGAAPAPAPRESASGATPSASTSASASASVRASAGSASAKDRRRRPTMAESVEAVDELLRPLTGKGEFRRAADETMVAILAHGLEHLRLCVVKQFLLAVSAGAFVSFGALLSVVISEAVESEGPARLLVGLGFAAGFSLVILSGAALFTECNVTLPMLLIAFRGRLARPVARFWLLVFVGNLCGAWLVAGLARGSDGFTQGELERLGEIVDKKLTHAGGGASGWFRTLLSAVLGNWLVGMAALNAASARTVPGKVTGIIFPVIAFAALGFQHSPANMGYFFSALAYGLDDARFPNLTWGNAVWGNLVPAAIGNIIGGGALVAGLFYYAYTPENPTGGKLRRGLDAALKTAGNAAPAPARAAAAHELELV